VEHLQSHQVRGYKYQLTNVHPLFVKQKNILRGHAQLFWKHLGLPVFGNPPPDGSTIFFLRGKGECDDPCKRFLDFLDKKDRIMVGRGLWVKIVCTYTDGFQAVANRLSCDETHSPGRDFDFVFTGFSSIHYVFTAGQNGSPAAFRVGKQFFCAAYPEEYAHCPVMPGYCTADMPHHGCGLQELLFY